MIRALVRDIPNAARGLRVTGARRCRTVGSGATTGMRCAVSVFPVRGPFLLPQRRPLSAGRGIPNARTAFRRSIPMACFRRSLRIRGGSGRFPAILAPPRRRGYIAAAETLSPSLHSRIEKVPCNRIRPRQTDGRHLRDRPFHRGLSRPYRSPFLRISRHPARARSFATRPPRPRPAGAGPIPREQPAGSGRLPAASA